MEFWITLNIGSSIMISKKYPQILNRTILVQLNALKKLVLKELNKINIL